MLLFCCRWSLVAGAAGLVREISRADEPRSAQASELRVLTYNIHHGEGTDGMLDLGRIARIIDSVAPDIVALQEVDHTTRRTMAVNQPAELARLTRTTVAFGGNFRFQGGEYGNAVLSRLPIKQHKNHLLPSFDGGEQRGVLEVEIEIPGESQPLICLATHLDFRPDDRERLESVAAIDQLLGDSLRRPALLAGDLNALPDSPTLRALARHWTRANQAPLLTSPADVPKRQIDFILYRPADRFRVKLVRVLDEPVASDHRPVLTVSERLPAATR